MRFDIFTIIHDWRFRSSVTKILGNTWWLVLDKLIRMGIGLFVGVWVARYLGPQQFGTFNYATAFVSFFTAFATLGLDTIVVRSLVKGIEDRNVIMGTTFLLKLGGGLVTSICVIISGYFFHQNDGVLRLLISINAIMILFLSFDTIDFWYQSQVQSKYTVFSKGIAYISVSILRVVLILFKASLVAFAIAGLLEIVLGGLALVLYYRINGRNPFDWKFDSSIAKKLLYDSSPLILANFFIIIYMRIDQVMIGRICNENELGIYSAAVKITELWYFIPAAIVSSTFPAFIKTRDYDKKKYYGRLQLLYSVLTWVGIVVAVVTTLFASKVVYLLYGNDYKGSGDILSISVWSGIFVSQGIARGAWLLSENLQKYSLYYISIGALINVVLNLLVIPLWGGKGAAFTTMFSQLSVAIIAPAFFKETRISSIMLIKSFIPRFLQKIS